MNAMASTGTTAVPAMAPAKPPTEASSSGTTGRATASTR